VQLRARAIARFAEREGVRPLIPLVVLAEVYRGDATDAGIDRMSGRAADVVPLTPRLARLAGQLRTDAGRGSAVDVIVVATAVRVGGAVVATADPEDLEALAAGYPNVRIGSLNEPHPDGADCGAALRFPPTFPGRARHPQ
jgi:predicted nucleic acid-binding protein